MSYFSDRSGPSYRPLNLMGLSLCGAALTFAVVYLQGELALGPCPLCTATRLILLLQGSLFLLAFLHNPRQLGQRAYALLGLLVALAGLALNLHHAWLQYLPAGQENDCGLSPLLQSTPPGNALAALLGDGLACAPVQWQWLGLSLPQHALLLFVLVIGLLVAQLRKRRERNYFS